MPAIKVTTIAAKKELKVPIFELLSSAHEIVNATMPCAAMTGRSRYFGRKRSDQEHAVIGTKSKYHNSDMGFWHVGNE